MIHCPEWVPVWSKHPDKTHICRKDYVFPLSKIMFEGKTFSAPNDPEKYLEVLYGDYMSFPKKDLWHVVPDSTGSMVHMGEIASLNGINMGVMLEELKEIRRNIL